MAFNSGTVLFLLCAATPLSAQTLRGFSLQGSQEQTTLEQALMKLPTAEGYKRHLQSLTQSPHMAGSPENAAVATYMADAMKKAGFQIEIFPYDLYLPEGPGEISLELVTPTRIPLNTKEYVLQEDIFSQNEAAAQGWNAFSGSGEATGEVVYANYGTKEDFEKLKEMGVQVKDKIVIARYGGNFRGYKAKFAQAYGAKGLIIYTDPSDAGYMRGLPYPEGTYFTESTIQRGSLLTLDYTGDPLTPFHPALPTDGNEKVDRLDPSKVDFHRIPVTPIGYGSAKEILSRMKGQPVPNNWQGGLPFYYRVEGGKELTVSLKVKQNLKLIRCQNVVGTLEGSDYPDEWIIMGSHYDAWVYGASDPNSGTAMLLTLADALGHLNQQGHRPKRTIKIAHWDAEEQGIIGSTEWVEQFRDELSKKGVAYFNADGACSGKSFGSSASPSLKGLVIEATKAIPYRNSDISVYQHWMERSRPGTTEPPIGNLGGGSDHLGFYAHVGIPSLGASFGGPTLYHSAYDDFYWYSKFADPEFLSGPNLAQIFGVMAMRLANSHIIPLDISRYGKDLNQHLATAEKAIQQYKKDYSLQPLHDLASKIETTGKALEAKIVEKLAKNAIDKQKAIGINEIFRLLERHFIDEKGMDYGAWYRSLYASSDPYSGYASWMLPGLLYEASLQSAAKLPEWETRYHKALTALHESMERALGYLK